MKGNHPPQEAPSESLLNFGYRKLKEFFFSLKTDYANDPGNPVLKNKLVNIEKSIAQNKEKQK